MSFRAGRDVVEHLCWSHGITVDQLLSGRRLRTIARVRSLAAIELRLTTTLSWSEIGLLIGRKTTPRKREYFKY